MNQAPSALSFTSLDEAVAVLPGIIRTLPANCQPQVKVLTDALLATAIREQVASEPRVPPFDLSRFSELTHKPLSCLSPADSQYMLRATVSYLAVTLLVKLENNENCLAGEGYTQVIRSLLNIYEISTEMLVDEAAATAKVINAL